MKPLPLSDLVRNYGKILPEVLKDAVQPVYNFDLEEVFSPGELEYLVTLGAEMPLSIWSEDGPIEWRGPLPGQQHVIAALTKSWSEHIKKIIIRGEAGIGKTQIALMALDMADRAGLDVFPAVIIEPRRVTKQWRERIKVIVPDAITIKLERPADVELMASMNRVYRGRKRIFGLIPTSMLSRSPGRSAASHVVSYSEIITSKGSEKIPHSPMLLKKYGEHAVACPTCYQPMVDVVSPWSRKLTQTIEDTPGLEGIIKRGFSVCCPKCGGPLFQETAPLPMGRSERTRSPQYDVGEYIYRNRKRLERIGRGPFMNTLVIDELHKMANDSSIRGSTTYTLARMSEYLLGLTATLYGGQASSLFWLYFMFNPHEWPNWGDMDQAKALWMKELANVAKVTKKSNNGWGKDSKTKKELPSAPPRLVAMMATSTVHVKLGDLGIKMPPLQVSGLRVKLDADHHEAYMGMFKSAVAAQQSGKARAKAAGKMQSSLTYAIAPTLDYHSIHNPTIRIFPDSYVCAPERALLKFVLDELNDDRKTIIYVTHTDVRDIVPRLMDVLSRGQVTSVRLPKSLDREDMPAWLREEAPKYDAVILNQKAIEGVDAVKFQNVFFYEIDYSVYPVDQASRRHWRLGQIEYCKTVFMEVEHTMLFRALALVMQRMAAASVLYGDDIEAQVGKYSAHSLITQAIKEELAGVELPDLGSLYQKAAEAITNQSEEETEEPAVPVGNSPLGPI